jgi:hypothetical protein
VREDGSGYINLNPQIEADNVTLHGTFEEDRAVLQGEWIYGGWGIYNQGRFEAERR